MLKSYRNVYKKSSAKRECRDENVFPIKADGTLNKLNLLFHLTSKTNLVTLRKFYSYPQHYKIDLSFSIKSQNRAQSATIESCALGALKLASDEYVPVKQQIFITIPIQNGGERANLYNDLFKKYLHWRTHWENSFVKSTKIFG